MRRTLSALAIVITSVVAPHANARLTQLTFDVHPTSFYDYAGAFGGIPAGPGFSWSIVVDDFRGNPQGGPIVLEANPRAGGSTDLLPSFLTSRFSSVSAIDVAAAYLTVGPAQQPSIQPVLIAIESFQHFRIPGVTNSATARMTLGRYLNVLPPLGQPFAEFVGANVAGPFNMVARIDPASGDPNAVPVGPGYLEFNGYATLTGIAVLPPPGFAPSPVPEPSVWAFFGAGLAGLILWQRRSSS